jgi:hypothetical protein
MSNKQESRSMGMGEMAVTSWQRRRMKLRRERKLRERQMVNRWRRYDVWQRMNLVRLRLSWVEEMVKVVPVMEEEREQLEAALQSLETWVGKMEEVQRRLTKLLQQDR